MLRRFIFFIVSFVLDNAWISDFACVSIFACNSTSSCIDSFSALAVLKGSLVVSFKGVVQAGQISVLMSDLSSSEVIASYNC
ncbi:hypothetical protein D9M71_798700 [compost metagenome]